MIISIFGPDGVGKTTHANLIVEDFAKKGYKVKKVWIKNNHMLAFIIITILKKLSKNSVMVLPSNSILTNILACSNRLSKRIWLWIDLFSVTMKLITTVYIPRILGYVIVAERYLPDTIVSMVLTVRDFNILKSYPIKFLLCLLRKDKVVLVMLDRSYELIRSEREWVEPETLIFSQKLIYRAIAGLLNIPIISTNASIDIVHNKIINIIKS